MKINTKFLGEGIFGSVYDLKIIDDRKIDPNLVVKVWGEGRLARDPWFIFAKMCKTMHSKYLPQIYYYDDVKGIAIMEKLYAELGHVIENKKFIKKYFFGSPDEQDVVAVFTTLLEDVDPKTKSVSGKITRTMRRLKIKPKQEFKDFIKFLDKLQASLKKKDMWLDDMHEGNIMVDKNMNLKIVDPCSSGPSSPGLNLDL
jgi:hypothetical protein